MNAAFQLPFFDLFPSNIGIDILLNCFHKSLTIISCSLTPTLALFVLLVFTCLFCCSCQLIMRLIFISLQWSSCCSISISLGIYSSFPLMTLGSRIVLLAFIAPVYFSNSLKCFLLSTLPNRHSSIWSSFTLLPVDFQLTGLTIHLILHELYCPDILVLCFVLMRTPSPVYPILNWSFWYLILISCCCKHGRQWFHGTYCFFMAILHNWLLTSNLSSAWKIFIKQYQHCSSWFGECWLFPCLLSLQFVHFLSDICSFIAVCIITFCLHRPWHLFGYSCC